jgi:hypothetical protein
LNPYVFAYIAGNIATFLFLVVEDWPYFSAWNWIIILPINEFLAAIWPLYWLILRWIF